MIFLKKIDFHIHTKSSISDCDFNFNIEKLKQYIKEAKLDAIAITNHNLFDKDQFEQICREIDIMVFPGIEIDLEGGHILLIGRKEEIQEFSGLCSKISQKISKQGDSLSYNEFNTIFTNLSKYLLIPHYKKEPHIKQEIIEKLGKNIFVGEVTNPKKWNKCIKDNNEIVPVLFSDIRISDTLEKFSMNQTYIKCDDLTLDKIKLTLKEKKNVFLSKDGNINNFQILKDGTSASTMLNIILGKRSSGKTYTLDTIEKNYPNMKIKYIRQFSLVSNSDKEKFDQNISKQENEISENYLKELKEIVEDVSKIDNVKNDKYIEEYITTLKEYAQNTEKNDIYSRTKLFNETNMEIKTLEGLQELINSCKNLIEDVEYKEIIDMHMDISKLKDLFIDLVNEYNKINLNNKLKTETNNIVNIIKSELGQKSSINPIKEFSIKQVANDLICIEKFNQLINVLNKEIKISEEDKYGFKIATYVKRYKSASDLKTKVKCLNGVSEEFKSYNKDAFDYLNKIYLQIEEKSMLYRCFWKIDFKVLNKNGNELSGGEKAEYNLLSQLEDAYRNDIVLIDEPESSFDNIFLKSNVMQLIKDISEKTTVFLATHNNTLGTLVKADCIIYTENTFINNENKFLVYTGDITSKFLKTVDGKEVLNFNILMNTMEAGPEAYEERRNIYEAIKNK